METIPKEKFTTLRNTLTTSYNSVVTNFLPSSKYTDEDRGQLGNLVAFEVQRFFDSQHISGRKPYHKLTVGDLMYAFAFEKISHELGMEPPLAFSLMFLNTKLISNLEQRFNLTPMTLHDEANSYMRFLERSEHEVNAKHDALYEIDSYENLKDKLITGGYARYMHHNAIESGVLFAGNEAVANLEILANFYNINRNLVRNSMRGYLF